MDDLYCPACRLVLYRRGVGQATPSHCPRCAARSGRLVTLLALDIAPAQARGFDSGRTMQMHPVLAVGAQLRAGDRQLRSRHG